MKNKKNYFTDKHEKAVSDYLTSKNHIEKEKIYTEILQPVFMEMIEKIVFSYRFDRVLQNIDEHIGDCLSYLVIITHNYKENKQSKAFSYFSVIIRNYFFNVIKKNVTKSKEKITETGERSFFERIPESYDLEEEIEKFQFKKALLQNIDLWILNRHSTEDDIKTLKAIKILMQTIEEYDCFNKKAFFIFVKDLSGLSSKKLSVSLKHLKIRYKIFVDNWNNGIK